jgi:hypothetical protein
MQVSGTWTIASNVVNQTVVYGFYRTALYTATPPDTDDYSVTATVQSDGSGFGVGVIARASDTDATGYAVIGFGGDSFYLIRLDAGSDNILATMSSMSTSTPYDVEIEVDGDQVRARIDGGSWSTVTDANIASGGWGMVTYDAITGGTRWINDWAASDLTVATVDAYPFQHDAFQMWPPGAVVEVEVVSGYLQPMGIIW